MIDWREVIIFVIIATIAGLVTGKYIGSEQIEASCNTFNGFEHSDNVYICKKVGELPK